MEASRLAEEIIRVGIVGCGGIASQHVRGYLACEGVQIAAAADVDVQRAVDVAGPAHAHTSFHEMLETERLDAVSVCTPPKFHRDAVRASLEAGAHVLCEKPLAVTAEQARDMVSASSSSGKLLVTAFCHRFHEPVARAKEIVRSGRIGKVTMFRNRFGGKTDMAGVWFSNPDVGGGGCIVDTASHSVDLFRYLVGNPIKLAAGMATADSRYRVEDCGVLLLQTRDGAIGTIEASWTSPGSANVIEVYGTDGAVIIDYARGGVRYLLGSSGEWMEELCPEADRFVAQSRHFIDCVRGRSAPIVTGEDGLRACEIAEAAYAFAASEGCGWAAL